MIIYLMIKLKIFNLLNVLVDLQNDFNNAVNDDNKELAERLFAEASTYAKFLYMNQDEYISFRDLAFKLGQSPEQYIETQNNKITELSSDLSLEQSKVSSLKQQLDAKDKLLKGANANAALAESKDVNELENKLNEALSDIEVFKKALDEKFDEGNEYCQKVLEQKNKIDELLIKNEEVNKSLTRYRNYISLFGTRKNKLQIGNKNLLFVEDLLNDSDDEIPMHCGIYVLYGLTSHRLKIGRSVNMSSRKQMYNTFMNSKDDEKQFLENEPVAILGWLEMVSTENLPVAEAIFKRIVNDAFGKLGINESSVIDDFEVRRIGSSREWFEVTNCDFSGLISKLETMGNSHDFLLLMFQKISRSNRDKMIADARNRELPIEDLLKEFLKIS